MLALDKALLSPEAIAFGMRGARNILKPRRAGEQPALHRVLSEEKLAALAAASYEAGKGVAPPSPFTMVATTYLYEITPGQGQVLQRYELAPRILPLAEKLIQVRGVTQVGGPFYRQGVTYVRFTVDALVSVSHKVIKNIIDDHIQIAVDWSRRTGK